MKAEVNSNFTLEFCTNHLFPYDLNAALASVMSVWANLSNPSLALLESA